MPSTSRSTRLRSSTSPRTTRRDSSVSNVASVSLAIAYPTSIANAFKNIRAVAAATKITFPAVEKLEDYLASPEAFAVAAPAE
jgi:large subunit ribosomal protein LP0